METIIEKIEPINYSDFLTTDKDTLHTNYIRFIARYNRLVDICHDSADRIATLVTERDEANNKINDLNELCHELTDVIYYKNEEIGTLNEKVKGLTIDLTAKNVALGMAKLDVEKLNKCIMEKNGIINTANDVIVNLRYEIGANKEEHDKSVKYWKTKYLATKQERDAFMEEVKELKDEFEEYKEDHEGINAPIPVSLESVRKTGIPNIELSPEEERYIEHDSKIIVDEFHISCDMDDIRDILKENMSKKPDSCIVAPRGCGITKWAEEAAGIIKRASSVICPQIKKAYFNGPTTTVLFDDGTHTCCTCRKGDYWNPDAGIAICIAKRIYGCNFKRLFRDLISSAEEDNNKRFWKACKKSSKKKKILAKNKVEKNNGEDASETTPKKTRCKKTKKDES